MPIRDNKEMDLTPLIDDGSVYTCSLVRILDGLYKGRRHRVVIDASNNLLLITDEGTVGVVHIDRFGRIVRIKAKDNKRGIYNAVARFFYGTKVLLYGKNILTYRGDNAE